MATFTVAATDQGVYDKTLTASTVDTVTWNPPNRKVKIYSDGTASITFTVDGTTPTVGMQSAFELEKGQTSKDVMLPVPDGPGQPTAATIKLISAGTPPYSIAQVD